MKPCSPSMACDETISELDMLSKDSCKDVLTWCIALTAWVINVLFNAQPPSRVQRVYFWLSDVIGVYFWILQLYEFAV
ncbi:hypothetical protein HanIR_Chr14g0692271 [Helianthus annuus]|nr:hypothetical protein HanIR_Chr14g0692271 [Helianthus annuus]